MARLREKYCRDQDERYQQLISKGDTMAVVSTTLVKLHVIVSWFVILSE